MAEAALKKLLQDLKALRSLVKKEKDKIGKKAPRDLAASCAQSWFGAVRSSLQKTRAVPPEVVERYSGHFTRLLKLSGPNNLKSSYLTTLQALISKFADELVIPVQQNAGQSTEGGQFESFLKELGDPQESKYYKEAVDCAQAGFLRAAAVLGWCAAIDRIHRAIAGIGFSKFNTVSAQMASQKTGRFKKFSRTTSVSSVGELGEVFDTDVLWIIEGMGLIDPNQHMRLRSCFELRCQCAHPGEAPVTPYNLMSFFSDIEQIVLRSATFGGGQQREERPEGTVESASEPKQTGS